MKVFRRIIRAFTFIWRHSLVQNERLSAFYRYIKFHIVNRNGQECIIPFLEHSLLITKGEGSQAHLFTYLADFEEMIFLLHYLNKDDRFIDVGANIGVISKTFLKLFKDMSITDYEIHCFEPNPNTFKDQAIFPFIEFTFNKSPEDVLAIMSPCFDKAKDKKFCDFIKDNIERTFQIIEPSFTLKERSLLS